MIKIKMSLFYLFLFLVVVPMAYSISLDELIASYNYTYSSGRIGMTGAAHYGNDTDGNLLYDYLVINITVDNLEGNYTFIGDLYRDGGLIATISDTYYLFSGGNMVQLYYDAKSLQNAIYNLSLTIQEDYLTVYRESDVYSFDFDNSLYEKPDINVGIDSYELVNNDADVKYEMLRVNTMINSTIDGTFEINALIGNGKTLNSKKNYSLSIGTNNIAIDFDGREIRKERINNSKLYLITIRDGAGYSFDFNYPLVYDLYGFDAGQSILIDSYSDGKVDLNANNLSEFLEIGIGLDINESGIYSIELEIEDLYDNYVKKVSEEFGLGMGEQIVNFRINGTDIYNSKVNGPYLLQYVKLSKKNVTLDSVSEPYITSSYNYDEFERPLMADLVIKSLEVAGETVNMNVANEGEGYAFAFNVEVFDDNFNSIKESLIDYLAPGDSRNVSYNADTSGILKLYAIVDYDNNIEESNESNNLFAKDLKEFTSFDISLVEGWNLISSPLNFTNISEVFNPIQLYFGSMFAYDGEMQRFVGIDPFNASTKVDLRYGAWVKVLGNSTLNIVGEEFKAPVNIPLFEGWNLIGYLYLNESLVNETLKDVNYSIVYGYNGSWLSYVPNRSFNSLQTAKPGYGYWVKVG